MTPERRAELIRVIREARAQLDLNDAERAEDEAMLALEASRKTAVDVLKDYYRVNISMTSADFNPNDLIASINAILTPTVNPTFAWLLAEGSMSDEDRIDERIEEIRKSCAKDNWDTYDAKAITDAVLTPAHLCALVARNLQNLEEIDIEPTPDGGVRVLVSRVFR